MLLIPMAFLLGACTSHYHTIKNPENVYTQYDTSVKEELTNSIEYYHELIQGSIPDVLENITPYSTIILNRTLNGTNQVVSGYLENYDILIHSSTSIENLSDATIEALNLVKTCYSEVQVKALKPLFAQLNGESNDTVDYNNIVTELEQKYLAKAEELISSKSSQQ